MELQLTVILSLLGVMYIAGWVMFLLNKVLSNDVRYAWKLTHLAVVVFVVVILILVNLF